MADTLRGTGRVCMGERPRVSDGATSLLHIIHLSSMAPLIQNHRNVFHGSGGHLCPPVLILISRTQRVFSLRLKLLRLSLASFSSWLHLSVLIFTLLGLWMCNCPLPLKGTLTLEFRVHSDKHSSQEPFILLHQQILILL